MNDVWILLIILFGLMLGGVPIAAAMGLSTIIFLIVFLPDMPLVAVAQKVVTAPQSFTLVAIPLFILAGKLMNIGGITDSIFMFARAVMGFVRGGLGHVNVMASIIFSGMSGSAQADVAGLGQIELQAMRKAGYNDRFIVGVTAASSTIGPIIPPSIPLVIYAVMAEVSTRDLFIAGILPGLLMGLSLMVLIFIMSYFSKFPVDPFPELKNVFLTFVKAFPALLAPVIIVGGMIVGLFTPTEAAAVAVLYALGLGVSIYGTLQVRDIPVALIETARITGVALFIFANAMAFGWLLTILNVPLAIAAYLMNVTDNPLVVLLIINVVLLIAGMFETPTTILVMLMPVLLPIVDLFGIDRIHFGIVVVLNLMLGMVTPPIGLNLFILSNVANMKVTEVSLATLPFLVPLFVALALVTV